MNWLKSPILELNLYGLEGLAAIDDLELTKRNDTNINDNLKKCPSLLDFFQLWNSLGKCHAVNMNSGSFFRLHRDAYKTAQQMRIFIPLNKTELHQSFISSVF